MKPFFQSVKHPHLWMNQYGVVFAPKGHPDACDMFWNGWDTVPLRLVKGDLRYEVEYEAMDAGYKKQYIGNCEVLFTKPKERAAK